ncbi:MSHA biogenesis protein MshQ [Morganella morganii]|nr:MSHA biogenesis protein MshQ [Morganella morganii]
MATKLSKMIFNKIIAKFPLILLPLIMAFTSHLVKADWTTTFIEGVNNYDRNGSITFNSSYLYNAPNNAGRWYSDLPTYNYFQGGYSYDYLCVTSNNSYRLCRAGDYIATLPSNRIDFSQCSSSSAVNVGPPTWNNTKIDIVEGEYNRILLEGGSDKTIRFVSDGGIYKMKSLTATSGRIELAAGQYWIETLSINDGVTLVFPTTGTVSFFIKNNYRHYNLNTIGQAEKFLIYSYSNFTLNGGASLKSYVVAEGNAVLDGSSYLEGAITARNISLGGNSSIKFDDNAAKIDVVPNCNPAPVLQCFNDRFSLGALSNDWVVSRSSGSFTPSVVSGRMRLTEAKSDQSTASTYQRLFPAANNLVEIQFDHYAYGGTGADGIAVVLSDAAITPQPGAFGGPLGYGFKPGINGFAGGWLGVGIDEFGNFSGEGGSSNIGQRRQSVAVRGSGAGTSGYRYLRGTCNNGTSNTSGNCLSPTVDGNNVSPAHRYKITIDSQISGQSMVKIERNTGSGFVTLIPAFNAIDQQGQAATPSDFLLSLTGSTGGSNNNHEIDNVQICALRSNPIGAQIDHFEFDHTGQGLTCNPETVTIRACANASCSQLFTDPLTATLLPELASEGIWIGGNQVSFSNGSTQLQLRRNTAGTVTLGVKGSSPTTKPLSKTLCRVGSGSLSENACSLTFADSGFIFDVPDKLANKPINVLVKAVNKSDETQQCVPSFQSQTKKLNFWSSYQTPSAPISPKAVTINNTAIGSSSASPTALNLVFDTNGQASISVNYPDAGKLQLDAQYIGSGNEQGLLMTGSDQFVSVPAGLCVKPVDASASCPSADMSCNAYRKAGQNFGMTVQAMAWEKDSDKDFCSGNLSTPNFSDQAMRLASKVVAPSIASGGHDGALGVASYSHSAQANNLNTLTNQTISEVGVFQIAAQASPNYLGTASSLNIPIGYSANIGRFVPDRFLVSDISVIPACGGFNYMDQLFPMSMKLSALNIAGDITKNYFPPFSLATAKLVGENNNNGVDLQSRLSSLHIKADSWDQGVATVDASYLANFSRVTPNVATNLYQDGPFESLDIGVQLMDNDPHPNSIYSYVASPDMDAATTGNCTNCSAKKISTQILRHGRVVMDNTYGPETEILRMPTRAEYWDGSRWVLNTNDSCTTAVYGLGSQVDNAGLGYNFDPDLVAGQSVVRSGGTATFQAGQFELLWQAVTSSGAPYRGQVTAPLDVPPWLEWYWNWNGVSPSFLTEPRASAYFGRYRGHDRIIYWREVN